MYHRQHNLLTARVNVTTPVWAYHRFALSTADVEDLLAERGVIVSREAVRLWVNRFGAHFSALVPPGPTASEPQVAHGRGRCAD
jgi:transposase-like protein